MESSEEDFKKYALRIYTIIKNGPLDKGGANELTDFIIPPEELFLNQVTFEEWVHSHANQQVTLSLYSLLTRKFRDITIITNPIGSKDGILGASVKKENWTIANKNVLHITSVEEGSFAQKELGLIPLEDYIIGVKTKTTSIVPLNQDNFTPLEILGEVIRKNKGKLMKFYIYNKNKGARDVTVTIGDDYYFSLGCEGAFGALHMFPTLETKDNIIDNNIEKTEELLKEIKESINDIKVDTNYKNNNDNNNIKNDISAKKEEGEKKDELNKKEPEENKNNNNDNKDKKEINITLNKEEGKNNEKEEDINQKDEKTNNNINKIAEELSAQKEIENKIEKEEPKKEEIIEEKEIKEEQKVEKTEEKIQPENLLDNMIKYKEEEKKDVKAEVEQKEEEEQKP